MVVTLERVVVDEESVEESAGGKATVAVMAVVERERRLSERITTAWTDARRSSVTRSRRANETATDYRPSCSARNGGVRRSHVRT